MTPPRRHEKGRNRIQPLAMNPETIQRLTTHFESLRQHDENISTEFWYARDLQDALGYARWENFHVAIVRAKNACEAAGCRISDHFRDVTKMVFLGSGSQRAIEDLMLTRYACYLIAMNGDPRKQEIAFAQSYFALQTRRAELIDERIKLNARLAVRDKLRASEKTLSQNLYERGIDDQGFARIRSKGDEALFGKTTAAMKKQYGISESKPLADILPTLTIAAKNLAVEMTNHNTQERDLQGEAAITTEHVQNNTSVRGMLANRGIYPEALPPAEDIKKIERRVKRDEKKLADKARLIFPSETNPTPPRS